MSLKNGGDQIGLLDSLGRSCRPELSERMIVSSVIRHRGSHLARYFSRETPACSLAVGELIGLTLSSVSLSLSLSFSRNSDSEAGRGLLMRRLRALRRGLPSLREAAAVRIPRVPPLQQATLKSYINKNNFHVLVYRVVYFVLFVRVLKPPYTSDR